MNKKEYLASLGRKLRNLSAENKKKWLDYYSEIISDRMEEGLSEQDAVAATGSTDVIAEQIISETDPADIKKDKPAAWQIVLIVLGSPLWISLLLAAFSVVLPLVISVLAVVLALFITMWAVVISLYCVVLALVLGGIAGLVLGIIYTKTDIAGSVFILGASLVCIGAGILLFFGVNQVAKGAAWVCKKLYTCIAGYIKREGSK